MTRAKAILQDHFTNCTIGPSYKAVVWPYHGHITGFKKRVTLYSTTLGFTNVFNAEASAVPFVSMSEKKSEGGDPGHMTSQSHMMAFLPIIECSLQLYSQNAPRDTANCTL